MAPLLTLVIVTLLARGVGALGVDYVATWPDATAVGLAAMFLLTASAHWTQPRRDGLIAIVPPSLPRPDLLVTVTGVLEIAGAVGLLLPATRVAAAVCLSLLLLVMFPANVRGSRIEHPAAPHTPLLPRTAMQVLFVGAAALVATS